MSEPAELPEVAADARIPPPLVAAVRAALGKRSIVLVGMMGAGKSSIGRRLAAALAIPFLDADIEIEKAAGMSIPEIFESKGEPYFRAGEARVLARLLEGGPQVLATGGGAFMNERTRENIRSGGVSIWLKADLDVLLRRVKRRADRPLLKSGDPAETLERLMAARDPVYALADLTVNSREVAHETIVAEIVAALARHFETIAGACAMRTPPASNTPLQEHMKQQDSKAAGIEIVNVALGARAYDIVIGRGVLESLGARIAALKPGARAAIVTDDNVATHCLPAARASLAAAGIAAAEIVVPAGEASKSFATLERVCEELIAARIERNDVVIALGGGVVGDLAGFAASIVRRGVDYVQVPTSLLAQVDSSVGGKTAIDSAHGKNLVGAFYQPILVIADTALLDTLPPREFRAGYAEVAKYGLLGDASFFGWLEANAQEVFAGGSSGSSAREHAIAVSCRMKAEIVARDERETGDRALLNLGHTFGHAFEAAAGFSGRLLHGEAVALGCAMAMEFSARHQLMPMAEAERAIRHLAAVGLPTKPSQVEGGVPGVDRLMELIAQDKKVKRGKLTFILARGIGKAFVAPDVDPNSVRSFIAEKIAVQ